MRSDRKFQDNEMVDCAKEALCDLGERGVVLDVTNLQAHDAILGHAAVAALESNTGLPHARLRIDVDGGWILLSGEVDNQAQKVRAALAIECIDGLRGFTNALEVRQSPEVATAV